MNEFRNGFKDSIPIGLGYLAVSFGLGVAMLSGGITTFQGAVMSLTNITSAGEFAGVKIIIAGGTIVEMILTQFIINIRYALMSLSLSQKLPDNISLLQRLVIAFANTDEIFAVAMSRKKELTFKYMLGLQIFPIICWVAGTILGNVSAGLMPVKLSKAMSFALYGMFIAIVLPEAKKHLNILFVVILSVLISCFIYYIPIFSFISNGISIILATVISAGIGAAVFPHNEE